MARTRSLDELKEKAKDFSDCIRTYRITKNIFYKGEAEFWGSAPIVPPTDRDIENAFKKNNAHDIAKCIITIAKELTQLGEFKKADKLLDDALLTDISHDHCGSKLPGPRELFGVFKSVIKHHNIKSIKQGLHSLHIAEPASPYQLIMDCKSQIKDIRIERGLEKPLEIELEEKRTLSHR